MIEYEECSVNNGFLPLNSHNSLSELSVLCCRYSCHSFNKCLNNFEAKTCYEEKWKQRRLVRKHFTNKASFRQKIEGVDPENTREGDWGKSKVPETATCWCVWRLKAGGEGDNRRWDGWMASPAQWTWVWVSSWSWWWTGRPGVLQSMGSQRDWHDRDWTEGSQGGQIRVSKRGREEEQRPHHVRSL